MKKTFAVVISIFVAATFLFSCDKIEGSYYEIIKNEEINVTFPELNPDDVYRKILIDEFTGHMCSNCPDGHATLENLHQVYGDTLVMIGIHYGSLAKPFGSTFTYDFRTEVGNLIGAEFGIDGIPAAIVNRVYKSKGWPREQWATVVSEVDRSTVPVAIQMINELDATKQSLKVNVKVSMLKNYSVPLKLYLYLIEDNIVKPQKNGTETIMEYTHNHVLRSAFDLSHGFNLNSGLAIDAGESVMYATTLNYSQTDWNIDNCSVVALVVDSGTGEVLQVESLEANSLR